MVTYFNKKDLVEFGNYLFSEEREKSFIHTSAQAAVNGIDLISSWDRLRTVTHADVCNFIELQRNKQRATKSQPPKESNIPQWLVDHMATAPKELQNYVFTVFPERLPNSTHRDSVVSFRWEETPEDFDFWHFVNRQSWDLAIMVLREKNLLLKAAAPKIEAPQWLVDHMECAQKELQEYVFKVFPQRLTNSTNTDSVNSFTWLETPEGQYFWSAVNRKSWSLAIHELREKDLL